MVDLSNISPARMRTALVLTSCCAAGFFLLSACGGEDDPPANGTPVDALPDASASTSDDASTSPPGTDAGSDATTPIPEIVPAEDPTAHFGSGTRLRVRFDSDGTVRRFVGFEDTEYGPCAEANDETGTNRCLPLIDFTSYSEYYTDASCTDKLWINTSPSCDTSQLNLARVPSAACVGCAEVHELSPPITGANTAALFEKHGEACGPSGRRFDPKSDVRRVGAAISGDHFVAFEPATFGEGRVKARGVRATDGAFLSRQLFVDEQEQTDCAVVPDRDGTSRCSPNLAPFIAFADATCQSAPLAPFAASPTTPLVASYIVPTDNCATWRHRFFELGSPYVGPVFYGSPASCTPWPDAVEGSNTYSVGAEIDPARYEAMTGTLEGAGRLKRHVLRGASGGFAGSLGLSYEPLWDSALEVDCLPGLDRDGQRRCMPLVRYDGEILFTDATCTQPMFPERQCNDSDVVTYVPNAGERCAEQRLTAVRLGPAVDLPAPYSKFGTECRENANAGRARPVVAEIQPSELQPMINTVD